ncbi:hypothetical protein [uncultured Gordonia sp.]|uniref:hypothetical protein n=1 Tax=uncultured Gordonia sp. TaxID=198437 RepID=UPI00258A89D0|nr:hypothetical protein [uncultured Gordonia sp.]
MNRVIVRCDRGAYYSTIWWPLGSFKAARFGPMRVQRCPVHHAWEKTRRVDPSQLSDDVVAGARATTDWPIP